VTSAAKPQTASQSRRDQLLDAAVWAFARKGYRAASIGDIIARAGVARGTFYLYFDGKEQVFLAVIEEFQQGLEQMLAVPEPPVPIADHHGRAMLQRSFHRWLAFFADHRDAAAVVLKEATSIDPRFEASLARLRDIGLDYFAARFRRFQARGLVTTALPAELVAHLHLGMVDELVGSYVLRDEAPDINAIHALAGQLAEFAWDGIRPDRRY
jgi:AcrR family transcriptional regulator